MESPSHIGKYEILSILGRGGMGVVYRAQDPKIGRQVAIKTVTEGLTNDAGMLQRFYREAEKMGKLKHPNIITVYDLGEQDGFPYIVMEFVEGDPLDRIIKGDKQLSLSFKLRIVEQVCLALGYAHIHSVVHRDIKPANVIVRHDGLTKLLDFGIARGDKTAIDLTMTGTGEIIGTVPYMAPERLMGAPLDGRSDIFATGIMLYQLLTRNLPFTGDQLVDKLLNERHRPLSDYLEDYPHALDAILDRALAKNPDARYQTSDEMATDLFGVIQSLREQNSAQMVALAEQLVAKQDFAGGRDILNELLLVDNQHAQARRFLGEINQKLALQYRAEQVQQKRRKADEALQKRNFDEAIQALEEALKLTPDDKSLANHLAEVRKNKVINDQMIEYLRNAEAAKKTGDYAAAQAIVEKAMKLDTNNSRLRAAYVTLTKQAEEAAQKAKVKSLMEAARNELSEDRFSAALAMIKQAEELVPADAELLHLRSEAHEGIAREERRRMRDEIEGLMAAAVTRADIQEVITVLQNALDKAPNDAMLLRYQAQLDEALRTHVRNDAVDAAVKDSLAVLETNPLQALEIIRTTLVQAPGDERLIALEMTIQERVARLTEQETRDAILLQAREALTHRRFAEAEAVLAQCRGSIRTDEVIELQEFAREQSEREQLQALVSGCYSQALNLQREGEDEALIELIQPVLNRTDDAGLRKMLAEARQRADERRVESELALNTLQQLLDEGCYEQVIAFAGELPERAASLPKVKEMVATATERWDHEWLQVKGLGHRYAALETPVPLDNREYSARLVWKSDPEGASKVLAGLGSGFEVLRTQIIDQALQSEMKTIQPSAGTNDGAATLVLDPEILTFASAAVQTQWKQSVKRKKRTLFRLLSKVSRKRASQ
jgi:eukaryotic-like serine/threonine-protein kinase